MSRPAHVDAVRAHITQCLIDEQGFGAVAVEADWPDAHRAGCWADAAVAANGLRPTDPSGI